MDRLRITWKRSTIGYRQDQAATIRSLGLKRLHQTVERPDTPVVRGMVHKVRHLVQVQEVVEKPAPRRRRASRKKQAQPEEAKEEAPQPGADEDSGAEPGQGAPLLHLETGT